MVNMIFDRIKNTACSVVGHSSLIDKKKMVYEKEIKDKNATEMKMKIKEMKKSEKLSSLDLNANVNSLYNLKYNEKNENESENGSTLDMWDLNKLFSCVGSKSSTYDQVENKEIINGNYSQVLFFCYIIYVSKNCCVCFLCFFFVTFCSYYIVCILEHVQFICLA